MEEKKFKVGDYAHTPRGFIGRVMVRKESDSDVIVYVETKNGVGNGWYREYDLKHGEDIKADELDDFIKAQTRCLSDGGCGDCPYTGINSCTNHKKILGLKIAKELKQLREANDGNLDIIESQRKENEKLRQECDDLHAENAKLEEHIKTLNEEIRSYNYSLKIEMLTNQVKELTKERDDLKEYSDKAREEIISLNNTIRKLHDEIKDLVESRDGFMVKCDELEDAKTRLVTETIDLEKERDKLRDKNEALMSNIDMLHNRCDKLEKERDELKMRLDMAFNARFDLDQVFRFKKRVEELEKECDDLKRTIIVLEDLNDKVKKEAESHKNVVCSQAKEINKLLMQREDLEVECYDLKMKLTKANGFASKHYSAGYKDGIDKAIDKIEDMKVIVKLDLSEKKKYKSQDILDATCYAVRAYGDEIKKVVNELKEEIEK